MRGAVANLLFIFHFEQEILLLRRFVNIIPFANLCCVQYIMSKPYNK